MTYCIGSKLTTIRPPSTRRARGFSLFELLVVLVIIFILVAILIPVVTQVRSSASKVVCASNLRQIIALLHLYAHDNGQELPVVYSEPVGRITAVPQAWNGHVVDSRGGVRLLVAPPVGLAQRYYVRDAKIFFCPSDDAFVQYRHSEGEFGWDARWWTDPESGMQPMGDNITRAMSYCYTYVPPGGDQYMLQWMANGSWKVIWWSSLAGFERHSVNQHGASSLSLLHDVLDPYSRSGKTLKGFHGDQWNVAYMDGHVAAVKAKQFLPYLNGPTPFEQAEIRAFDSAGR